MSSDVTARTPYIVPRYRAPDDATWYHVLHGNVPGHQLDFMYCAEVPQGPLMQTHFGHLARLMKYIEPREHAPYAFALGNLSRDDVQHEPGHGGLALIFGLRMEGVLDHAGRAMPPYAHGVVAVDRALDYITLLDAASVFYRRVLEEGSHDASRSFYRAYVDAIRHHPETVGDLLRRYVSDFDELPKPRPSDFSWDWVANEAALPSRITIVHADDDPFGTVAHVAAKLGAMLYRSNIKWTTISSGREFDIPGGLSIRFVPASAAPLDPKGLVVPIGDVPEDEAEMAPLLFGAKPRAIDAPAARVGWRQQHAARRAPAAADRSAPSAEADDGSIDVVTDPKSRRRLWLSAGVGGASACVIAAAVMASANFAQHGPKDGAAQGASPSALPPSPPRTTAHDTAPAPPDVETRSTLGATPPDPRLGRSATSPTTRDPVASPVPSAAPPSTSTPKPKEKTGQVPSRKLLSAGSPAPPATSKTIGGEPKF